MPKTKKHQPLILAIDVGGTKIMTALVSNTGHILAKERSLTLAEEGPPAVINRLLSAIDAMLSVNQVNRSQLSGISIACAGVIDLKRGLVTTSPHLPGWHDTPLRDIVSKKYEIETFLLNDASAATLGEHRYGAGKGVKNLVLLTIGTGIGGGIIINGGLYQGVSGSAGEIGHMTVALNGPSCVCGNIGCLERLASGTAMAEAARKRLSQGEHSSLVEMVAGKIEDITAEKIGVAARHGDSLAREIITEAGRALGVGLVNVVNLFNPEKVIISGGVAQLGDLFLAPARQVVQERAFPLAARNVRIVPGQLGDEAGVLGAAAFALEQIG